MSCTGSQRSTAYRARSRLEPSKVRVSSRRSEPGGRVSNADTLTDNAGADHEMQLIDQAGGEEVVPEDVTAKY